MKNGLTPFLTLAAMSGMKFNNIVQFPKELVQPPQTEEQKTAKLNAAQAKRERRRLKRTQNV